ncbi:MAG: hypothetical protein ABWK00_03045 [Desulfurococcaceae archaeon]
MPKDRALLLREHLRKYGLELLDVYAFRGRDYIRIASRDGQKVRLVRLERPLSQTTPEELPKLAEKLSKP